jgi:hypothetical protein
MVTRSAGVKLAARLIDNHQVHIILVRNRKTIKKTLVRGRPGPLNSWKSADAVAVTGSEDSRRTGEGKSLPAKSGSPQDDAVFASRREAADFIADYLTELMLVAVRHDMPDLAYSIGKSLSKANEKKAESD